MTTPMVIEGIEGLKALVGASLGSCEPFTVTQDDINAFAEVTGDDQWIHTNPKMAKEVGPFGGTVAHGYYLLSKAPGLLFKLVDIKNIIMGLNYGTEKVRFPEPCKVDSVITMTAVLKSLQPKGFGNLATIELTYMAEGAAKPCCVAEVLYMFG